MVGDAGRRGRLLGLCRLALSRLWKQATRTTSGRLLATVAGVALTVAVLLLVTGVGLALAGGGVATEDDADVRIAPNERAVVASLDGVEGPRLGNVTDRTDQLRSRSGIDHASPVLVESVRLEPGDGGESSIVLLVGVVPDGESRTVAGLPTDSLHGDGEGTIVLSATAADRFEGDAGTLTRASDRGGEVEFTVAATQSSTVEDAPVALVSLTDLQTLAGAGDDDLADRLLLWGDVDAAAAAGADAYPEATVERTAATTPTSLFEDDLAFATGLLAFVVGVGLCTAFIATTMGMTAEEDRRVLAILEAVGIPTYSRLTVVGISTLATTLVGAILGVGLGWLAIVATNRLVGSTVAIAHPLFVPYGLVVALVAGLLAVPYPLVVAARTSVLEEVHR